MTKNSLLSRFFKKQNFTFREVMLNIRSVINPAGQIPFEKAGLKQLSVDETIEAIIKDKLSIARFGDGEISIMTQEHGVGFQDTNEALAERLLQVFVSPLPNLLVGLPDQFLYISNSVRKTRKFWISFIQRHNSFLLAHLQMNHVYGNTNLSRFYMLFQNKEKAFFRFERLKKIWENLDILIVEGEFTRSGIGNDLYDNAKRIQRIVCPAKNAFDRYSEILNEVKIHGKHKLILVALGPTATVLAYDLAYDGYWTIDLGHLDVEYMWMLAKAKTKINIKGRFVNESVQSFDEELDGDWLALYNRQIISKLTD